METQTDLLADFRASLTPGRYVRVIYLSDIQEFIKTDALLRRVVDDAEQPYVELATGEQIPLNRLVSVAGRLSPLFADFQDYSCDC